MPETMPNPTAKWLDHPLISQDRQHSLQHRPTPSSKPIHTLEPLWK